KNDLIFVAVGSGGQNTVIIDSRTNTIVKEIPQVGRMAFDPTGQVLYVGNGNQLTSVSTQDYSVIQTVTIPDGGTGATKIISLALDPASRHVYAQDATNNRLLFINPVNLAVQGSVTIPPRLEERNVGIAVNQTGTTLAVAGDTKVSFIDVNTQTLTQSLTTPNVGNSDGPAPTFGIVNNTFKLFYPEPGQNKVNLYQVPSITGKAISLASGTGSIMAVTRTMGQDLTVNTGGSANASISELATANLGASSVAGSFLYSALGNVTTSGAISGGTVVLQTTGRSSAVDIGAPVTAT